MADPTYTLPTVDDITDTAVAYAANLLPDDDLARHSDQWKRIRVVALVAADIDYHGQIQRLDANPGTASGAALDGWGAACATPRLGATGGRGANALRVRGAPGSTFAAGLELGHPSGGRYALQDGDTIPAEGFIDATVIATTTGTRTNLEPGQRLTFDDPPTGIEQVGELVAAIEGGTDAEQDAPYRERVVDAWRRPRLGQTAADWRRWALEVGTGAAEAYVYRNRAGLGLVDVAALAAGTGEARALGVSERDALLAALEAARPDLATPRVLETIGEPVDVRILVQPMPGRRWAADWQTGGVAFTVAAWNGTTRVLKLSAARPASLQPGHRMIINRGDAAEAIVAALGPAADEVALREPLPAGWATPDVGDEIHPGGPLVEPMRAAIAAWIDQLGPALGGYGAGWKGALTRSDLFLVAQTLAGVLDSDVRTIADGPWSTVAAAEYLYPLDGSIGYLTPGRRLVVYTDAIA